MLKFPVPFRNVIFVCTNIVLCVHLVFGRCFQLLHQLGVVVVPNKGRNDAAHSIGTSEQVLNTQLLN